MRTDRVDELRLAGERRAHCVDLTCTNGAQQCADCFVARRGERLSSVDLGLEGTPASKPVLPRECKLRAGKLGVGVDFAERVELLLGSFPQPIETRPRWERLRHKTPSFVAPVSASAG
jgi:hypothetical protein